MAKRDSASIQGVYQEERYDPLALSMQLQRERQKADKEAKDKINKNAAKYSNIAADTWESLNLRFQQQYHSLPQWHSQLSKIMGEENATEYVDRAMFDLQKIDELGKQAHGRKQELVKIMTSEKSPPGKETNYSGLYEYTNNWEKFAYADLPEEAKAVADAQIPDHLKKLVGDNWKEHFAASLEVLAKAWYEENNKVRAYVKAPLNIGEYINKQMAPYKEEVTLDIKTLPSGQSEVTTQNMTNENYEKLRTSLFESPVLREDIINRLTLGQIDNLDEAKQARGINDIDELGFSYLDKEGNEKFLTDDEITKEIERHIPGLVTNKAIKGSRYPSGGSGSTTRTYDESNWFTSTVERPVVTITGGDRDNAKVDVQHSTLDMLRLPDNTKWLQTTAPYIPLQNAEVVPAGANYEMRPQSFAVGATAKKELKLVQIQKEFKHEGKTYKEGEYYYKDDIPSNFDTPTYRKNSTVTRGALLGDDAKKGVKPEDITYEIYFHGMARKYTGSVTTTTTTTGSIEENVGILTRASHANRELYRKTLNDAQRVAYEREWAEAQRRRNEKNQGLRGGSSGSSGEGDPMWESLGED